MVHKFNLTDKGYIGDPYEMEIKSRLSIKNADTVSAAGKTDFRFNGKAYDVKQNGSCIKYDMSKKTFVKGSSRVIYATHCAYTEKIENGFRYIEIDLENTEFFVVEKKAFIEFLASINCIKVNEKRSEVNIQTVWNYSKNAYHGRKGKLIEEWCKEHEAPEADEVINAILGW